MKSVIFPPIVRSHKYFYPLIILVYYRSLWVYPSSHNGHISACQISTAMFEWLIDDSLAEAAHFLLTPISMVAFREWRAPTIPYVDASFHSHHLARHKSR